MSGLELKNVNETRECGVWASLCDRNKTAMILCDG